MNQIYLVSFFVSLILALLVMPFVIRFSLDKGFYDEPDERKIHKQVVPRIGGVVFLPMSMLAMAVTCAIAAIMTPSLNLDGYGSITLQLLAVFIIFAVGVFDDLKGVRYRIKFVAQFVAGFLLCASGAYINNFHGILGLHEVPSVLGMAITVFAVIYCTNAINFIDGVDGQASAIATTALVYYAWLLQSSQPFYSILAITIAGALVGFMKFNVFGNPDKGTKTFMGDTGSLFLGLVMVFLGVVANNVNETMNQQHDTQFIMAFAPLFLPCLDVVRVVLHRIRIRQNPFTADKNHIHHKLLVMDITQQKVSLIVAVLNIVIIAFSCFLIQWLNANFVIIIVLILWTILNMHLTHLNLKKQKNKA